ncbi:MAG: ribosome small subunit-dependent GTPase A [Planctomycetota bacterium]
MTGAERLTGRVVAVHRGQCDVDVEERPHWVLCSVRGSFRDLTDGSRRTEVNSLAVGDIVDLTLTDETHGVVEALHPRFSELSRPAVHRDHLKQVLCANIHQVAILVSLREPRFKSQVIDRLLVIALWGNVSPIIILSKTDLGEKAEVDSIRDMYKGLDVPFIPLSSVTGEGLEEVRALLKNKITAFCGQSGVGKSTLLNSIMGEERVPTMEISAKTGKGRHTTSWAEIFTTKDGKIIDLPGNKQFDLFEIPREVVGQFLPDFQKLSEGCKFQPCSHTHEPKCAVRSAVESGALNADRYRNYCRIFETVGAK